MILPYQSMAEICGLLDDEQLLAMAPGQVDFPTVVYKVCGWTWDKKRNCDKCASGRQWMCSVVLKG